MCATSWINAEIDGAWILIVAKYRLSVAAPLAATVAAGAFVAVVASLGIPVVRATIGRCLTKVVGAGVAIVARSNFAGHDVGDRVFAVQCVVGV